MDLRNLIVGGCDGEDGVRGGFLVVVVVAGEEKADGRGGGVERK